MSQLIACSLESLKIGLFLGGPSNEKDISLDSARTFFDALVGLLPDGAIQLFFVDEACQISLLDSRWIYSNRIEDFSHHISKTNEAGGQHKIERAILACDVLCSFIHGNFGEDGQLNQWFEELEKRAYLGSKPASLALAKRKFQTNSFLRKNGLQTPPSHLFRDARTLEAWLKAVDRDARFAVKPNDAGSSDGVSIALRDEVVSAAQLAWQFSSEVIVEDYVRGREFSLVLIEDVDGEVLPLIPTEIFPAQSSERYLYSRTKKYLPGSGAFHATPGSLTFQKVSEIRQQAARIFSLLSLSDWARFDGFVKSDGNILWTDINGVPGFGVDSFLFQQAALFGLSQQSLSLFLIDKVLRKENRSLTVLPKKEESHPCQVAVLGGGVTSERHVSRMSWLNVINKLETLPDYRPLRLFVDQEDELHLVPNYISLLHTTDEIENAILDSEAYLKAVDYCAEAISTKSKTLQKYHQTAINFAPQVMTLEQLQGQVDFVFLGLHGGDYENGMLQRRLDSLGLPYNGPGPEASKVCADKQATGQFLNALKLPRFKAPNKATFSGKSLSHWLSSQLSVETQTVLTRQLGSSQVSRDQLIANEHFKVFHHLCLTFLQKHDDLGITTRPFVLKPKAEGCSCGVIFSQADGLVAALFFFYQYWEQALIRHSLLYGNHASSEKYTTIPKLSGQDYLIEEYVGGDPQRYLELTIGTFGPEGKVAAFLPSETVADDGILSLEEKFCKGGGTNLTPPDIPAKTVNWIQERVALLANALKLKGFCRMDLIYDKQEESLYLIEVNTLPGLSAATVSFTQALLSPGYELTPRDFIEKIIQVREERLGLKNKE